MVAGVLRTEKMLIMVRLREQKIFRDQTGLMLFRAGTVPEMVLVRSLIITVTYSPTISSKLSTSLNTYFHLNGHFEVNTGLASSLSYIFSLLPEVNLWV